MKVISYFDGQIKLNAVWDEFRPIGGVPHAAVINMLQDAYQFEQVGQSPAAKEAGMFLPMLAQGGFVHEGALVPINAVEFRPDSIVVTCPHTDISRIFLSDLVSKLVSDLGFRAPDPSRGTSYRSTVVSDVGSDLDGLLGKWEKIIQLYKSLTGNPSREISAYSLKFGSFGEETASDDDVIIERRFSAPAGEHWLYTQMAIDTNSHEKVLSALANIVTS